MTQMKFNPTGRHSVYADAISFGKTIDVAKHVRTPSSQVVTASSLAAADPLKLDAADVGSVSAFQQVSFNTWLPFAAKEYHISPDYRDYVLVPVIAMPTGLPNRNGVAFPLHELKQYSVEHGMIAYQTFKGKPVCVEHDNQDPTKAIGVIVDTAMLPMKGFGGGKVWKLVLLLAIDRTKEPERARLALSGEINSYSMGAWVGSYSCSYCGSAMGRCRHIDKRNARDFYMLNGKIVYRRVHQVVGFECSQVATPAFLSAVSNQLMPLS